MSETPPTGNYRTPASAPARYVCPFRYDSVSVEPGTCSRCGMPRVPLDDEEVRASLYRESDRRLERRQLRADVVAGFVGVSLAVGVYLALLSFGFGAGRRDDLPLFGRHRALALLVGVFIAASLATYPRLIRGTARATFAARRRRASQEIGKDVQLTGAGNDDQIAATSGVDPQTLPVAALLRWLNARQE